VNSSLRAEPFTLGLRPIRKKGRLREFVPILDVREIMKILRTAIRCC